MLKLKTCKYPSRNSFGDTTPLLILNCCLYRHDVPVELWAITHEYHFKQLHCLGLSDIASQWNTNKNKCQLQYGHIADWSASWRNISTDDDNEELITAFTRISNKIPHIIIEADLLPICLDLLQHSNEDIQAKAAGVF
jgi:hypothetical protein